MLDDKGTEPKPTKTSQPGPLALPPDLRQLLREWVDVDAVGAEGFWLWMKAVLPLLPRRTIAPPGRSQSGEPWADRVWELSRGLVDCGRECARLSVAADRYYRDNQILAVRLKALEAALRTFQSTRQSTGFPPDEVATRVADRYLPRR